MKKIATAIALLAALGVSFEAGRWAQHSKTEKIFGSLTDQLIVTIVDVAGRAAAGELTTEEAKSEMREAIKLMLPTKG